jgi:hypothetical protein
MHAVPLLATKDESGAYQFQPNSDLWDEHEQHFVFEKARHRMSAKDYHLVEFVLDDQTGDSLQFPPNPHDAMWVAEGADRANRQCPDVNTIKDYSVMEPICVCDDGERLIIRNGNPRREEWAFTLNFVKNGERPDDPRVFVSWDPGGSNQNGGSTRQ